MLNSEHYRDDTAGSAIRHAQAADGARKKAAILIDTVKTVCRLAGFRIEGNIRLTDRAGRTYDAQRLQLEMKSECLKPAPDADASMTQGNAAQSQDSTSKAKRES